MQLPESKIRQFQDLYKKRFGVELSKEEALEKGLILLRQMELIYQPITKEQLKKLQLYDEQQRNITRVN